MSRMQSGIGAIALAGMLAVVACAAPAPPPMPMQGTAEDEAAIRALTDRFITAFNANDVAAMTGMMAENYEVVEPDGTHVSGRAGYREMTEKGIAARQAAGLALTITGSTDFLKWTSATHAVVGGKYTAAGVPPGAPNSGSWLGAVTKSATGEWLYLSALAADYMPPPPAPAAAGS